MTVDMQNIYFAVLVVQTTKNVLVFPLWGDLLKGGRLFPVS